MAEFLESQRLLLLNEGGFTTLDLDTYRGIARRFWTNWPGWATIDANKPMAQGEIIPDSNLDSLVNTFYFQNFWTKIQGNLIDSQPIASYFYDWLVNAGANAIKNVQRVIDVQDDGIWGNASLRALNAKGDCLAEIHAARLAYYQNIGVGDNARFLAGWTNRANNLYEKVG